MSHPEFTKDMANKTITVKTSFDAPLKEVWRAWTDSDMLDQWWGPEPWKAVTKTMNFEVGGHWHYYMAGPNGERHYCRSDFESIDPEETFSAHSCFCNENGEVPEGSPRNHWKVSFNEQDNITNVVVVITFDSAEELQKHLEMGFEQGFTTGLTQLENIFAENQSK